MSWAARVVCLSCRHCGSEPLVRGGKQRFLCRVCSRRSCESPYGGPWARKDEQVVALLVERTSQRAIARALNVSRVTVADILKKGRAVDRVATAKRRGVSGSHAVARSGRRGVGVGRDGVIRWQEEEPCVGLDRAV